MAASKDSAAGPSMRARRPRSQDAPFSGHAVPRTRRSQDARVRVGRRSQAVRRSHPTEPGSPARTPFPGVKRPWTPPTWAIPSAPREQGWALQETLDRDTAWYVDPDGGLDLAKLIRVLQDFFRRHSEHWKNRFEYEEAWPRILLQAFLHRVANGGGRIGREYGLGRGRVRRS